MSLTWVDYTLLGVVALSVIVSLLRGFVREALSLAGWIAAFWLGWRFSPALGEQMSALIDNHSVRLAIAFIVLFVVVLFAFALVNLLVGQFMNKSKLAGTDRALGAVFGLARGVVLVIVAVFLGTLTPLPEAHWWRDSQIIEQIEPLAGRLHKMAPPDATPQPPQDRVDRGR